MEKISNDYRENVRMLDSLLGVGRSCDMVSRDYLIGGRRARLWVVDGFGSDSILERMGRVRTVSDKSSVLQPEAATTSASVRAAAQICLIVFIIVRR